MGNNSIYELEKKVEKEYKQGKLKGYLSNEYNLNTFLFRSETTEEWVVGAKRLGKAAVDDEDSRKYLEDSINDKKEDDDKNLHMKRHAQCALLSYYTECIKAGKDPEIKLDNRKEKTVEEYFLEIFRHFEIAGIQRIILNKGKDNIKNINGNEFKKIKDLYLEPVQTKIDVISNDISKKEQILKNEKSKDTVNEKKIKGINNDIKEREKKIEELNELLSLMGKSVLDENEKGKIFEIIRLDNFKPTKDPEEFFKFNDKKKGEIEGFDAWEIGSMYFSFPAFYKIMNGFSNKNINKDIFELNWNFILSGMIFFDGVKSQEYLKNGIYILNSLKKKKMKRIDFIIEYIKNNKSLIISDYFYSNSAFQIHFAEFIFEISKLLDQDSLKIIEDCASDKYIPLFNSKKDTILEINKEENFNKKIKKLFFLMNKSIINIIETEDIFESQDNMFNEVKVLYEISLKKYNNHEKSLQSLTTAIFIALKKERQMIPFLTRQLKYVFNIHLKNDYNKYLKKKEFSKNFKRTVYKQTIITSRIIPQFNIHDITNKQLGTIIANNIKYAYLYDDEVKKNFYKEVIYLLLYMLPPKNVIKEISDYIPIKEIETEFEKLIEIIVINAQLEKSKIEKKENQTTVSEKKYNDIIQSNFKEMNGIEVKDFLKINNNNIINEMLYTKFLPENIEDNFEIFDIYRGYEFLKIKCEGKRNEQIDQLEKILEEKKILQKKSNENIKDIINEILNLNDLSNWVSKNIPYHYIKILNSEIKKERDLLTDIRSDIDLVNVESVLKKSIGKKYEKHHEYLKSWLIKFYKNSGDETKILNMYKDEKYKKYQADLESWLGKRFLIPEILKVVKQDKKENDSVEKIKTMFSESKFVRYIGGLYNWVTTPYIALSYVFIPFFFYLINAVAIGNAVLAIQISLTTILLPAIIISMTPFAIKGLVKKYKNKKKETSDLPNGLSVIDAFYPKMLGVILIGFLATITADESWAVALNSTSYFIWIFLLYLMITLAFLKKNIVDTVGDIRVNSGEEQAVVIPDVPTRILRVFSIALLQIFFVAQFFIMLMSNLMIVRVEAKKVILPLAGETVLNIPKIIKLKILIPDITTFSIHFKEIVFSPFMLINTMIVILFVGVVLQLYMNKEKVN